jgi:uncharacterized membrane protein required for colicin V production
MIKAFNAFQPYFDKYNWTQSDVKTLLEYSLKIIENHINIRPKKISNSD